MASKPFRFKQFGVADDRCTHKVGTDGVLLGSWVTVASDDLHILDIGTGSGLIALMLAQRSNREARIDAIEIEATDAAQAMENVQQSPWPEKITVWESALQTFAPLVRYDLIVSNPPFFVNSLLPPEKKRASARHAQTLPFKDLLSGVARLLNDRGRFGVVLPVTEGMGFSHHASDCGLHACRITTFRTRAHKPAERLLIEYGRKKHPISRSEIVLYGEGDNWSEGYRRLTGEFYLKG